jgi:pyridoxamine 5'-phosphate oxidase
MTPILVQLTFPGGGLTVVSAPWKIPGGVEPSAKEAGVPTEPPSPAGMRRDYTEWPPLVESRLATTWTSQFAAWFADATAFGLPEPNAMIVATVGEGARPSARTVLLKGYAEDGFVFFTNYESRKGTELAIHPYASLVFPWFPMQRQVIVAGSVERVSRAETEEYFGSRPRGSQLGAWASPQSRVLPGPEALDEGIAAAAERFGAGPVPAPPHWGGFRVRPDTVEFWQGRSSRLHDRLRFRRDGQDWIVERLAP